MQELSGFQSVTTYSTIVDGSTRNSLREDTGSNVPTASEDYRDIEFDPRNNLVRYNIELGGTTPWDSRYFSNNGSTSFDPMYITEDDPDSAQTATTLMTGVKTFKGAVGVGLYERPRSSLTNVASIMECVWELHLMFQLLTQHLPLRMLKSTVVIAYIGIQYHHLEQEMTFFLGSTKQTDSTSCWVLETQIHTLVIIMSTHHTLIPLNRMKTIPCYSIVRSF